MVSTSGKPAQEQQSEARRRIKPEDMMPYPMTVAQNKNGWPKKELTETPEIDRIEEETISRWEKKRKSIANLGQTKIKSN